MSSPESGPRRKVAGLTLLPGGGLRRTIVHLADGRVAGLELDPSRAVERALRRDGGALLLASDELLAPAFVDIHCHGAGGGDAFEGADSLGIMAATLRRHGVGAFLATVMTAPLPRLMEVAREVARAVAAGGTPGTAATGEPGTAAGGTHGTAATGEPVTAAGGTHGTAATGEPGTAAGGTHGTAATGATLLGLHLEGPALSPVRSGGHDQGALLDAAELGRALEADRDAWRAVRVVTLAPELEGGMELLDRLACDGIVVSVGHTDASAEVAAAAYAAGARSTTHLFNGMPPLHHRDPGPVGAALASAPFIELICDGVHVDTRILAPVARAIGEDRLILVSDALPLAGSHLRSVSTPGSSARIRGGRAVHPDGTIAGSRLLLDGMVAGAVGSGIPLPTALRAATENPARLLGLRDRGSLAVGTPADLVVVSRAGRLRRVLAAR